MTTEEKELLLKDLCTRLPYGVKINCNGENEMLYTVAERGFLEVNDRFLIEDCKPYLRPMSSMTEEERNEWADLFNLELDKLNEIDDEDKAEELAPYYFGKCHQVSIDWLNSHHFDYRGLIEKGLALESSEGMYNIKD